MKIIDSMYIYAVIHFYHVPRVICSDEVNEGYVMSMLTSPTDASEITSKDNVDDSPSEQQIIEQALGVCDMVSLQ